LITDETKATLSTNDGAEQTVDLEDLKITFRFEKA
jgi:hypothetical protein